MKIHYFTIAMLLGVFTNSQAVLTQLTIYSKTDGFFRATPLPLGESAKLVLTYDSDQLEDPKIFGDPLLDTIKISSSMYTVTNYTAILTVGSYVWTSNDYTIELGNNVPYLAPQDYIKVRFTTLAPTVFASLGFLEATDSFQLYYQDTSIPDGEMDFIDSTNLPSQSSAFNLEDIEAGDAFIGGDTSPINWTSFFSRPSSIEITQIPEVGATSLVLFSLLTLVFSIRHNP